MHLRLVGPSPYPRVFSLCHLFEAFGDELVDALAGLRGLLCEMNRYRPPPSECLPGFVSVATVRADSL
jgi:hypothetical protein